MPFWKRVQEKFNVSVEMLIVLISTFWILVCNQTFLSKSLQGHSLLDPHTWLFLFPLLIFLISLFCFMFSWFIFRWNAKWFLIPLLLITPLAAHFVDKYGVYLYVDMIRNIFRTDISEAKELLSLSVWFDLFVYGIIPALLLFYLPIKKVTSLKQKLFRRIFFILGSSVLMVLSGLLIFQPFSSLMRQEPMMRHQLNPANYLWGISQFTVGETPNGPRQIIGADAHKGTRWQSTNKPFWLIIVVGETARGANWQLNGYPRETTPKLLQQKVINFSQTSSCGTDTETSVPCMFSPLGRRQYDETKIQTSESLLHLINRVGIPVIWRDNQSGCKGVCDNLPKEKVIDLNIPNLSCDGERCLDEGLLYGLDQRLIQSTKANQARVLVLHQLGNHGPSYFRRYPPEFEFFTPVCRRDDLGKCTQEEITNAYDNALRYTDFVLSSLIDLLKKHEKQIDSVVIYVSDHGESLGEKGLYLHGIPYLIAPAEQIHVPMFMWFSSGAIKQTNIDTRCLSNRANSPSSHDYLFSTVLSLLDIKTKLYDPTWDLTTGCNLPR